MKNNYPVQFRRSIKPKERLKKSFTIWESAPDKRQVLDKKIDQVVQAVKEVMLKGTESMSSLLFSSAHAAESEIEHREDELTSNYTELSTISHSKHPVNSIGDALRALNPTDEESSDHALRHNSIDPEPISYKKVFDRVVTQLKKIKMATSALVNPSINSTQMPKALETPDDEQKITSIHDAMRALEPSNSIKPMSTDEKIRQIKLKWSKQYNPDALNDVTSAVLNHTVSPYSLFAATTRLDQSKRLPLAETSHTYPVIDRH